MRLSARAIVIKDNSLLVMGRNRFGLEFLALPGGEIEPNETAEQAAHRELNEECMVEINNLRLVIIEDAGEVYGLQYIYLADYVSGQPKLDDNSIEAQLNKQGKNLYEPKWLPLEKLKQSQLLPAELKLKIVEFIENGFPQKAVKLKISKDSKV